MKKPARANKISHACALLPAGCHPHVSLQHVVLLPQRQVELERSATTDGWPMETFLPRISICIAQGINNPSNRCETYKFWETIRIAPYQRFSQNKWWNHTSLTALKTHIR